MNVNVLNRSQIMGFSQNLLNSISPTTMKIFTIASAILLSFGLGVGFGIWIAKRFSFKAHVVNRNNPNNPNNPNNQNFKIFVGYHNKTFTIYPQLHDSIYEVKEKILKQEALGGSPNDFRLVFCGRQLRDQKTLMDENITKDATLWLICRLRGD